MVPVVSPPSLASSSARPPQLFFTIRRSRIAGRLVLPSTTYIPEGRGEGQGQEGDVRLLTTPCQIIRHVDPFVCLSEGDVVTIEGNAFSLTLDVTPPPAGGTALPEPAPAYPPRYPLYFIDWLLSGGGSLRIPKGNTFTYSNEGLAGTNNGGVFFLSAGDASKGGGGGGLSPPTMAPITDSLIELANISRIREITMTFNEGLQASAVTIEDLRSQMAGAG